MSEACERELLLFNTARRWPVMERATYPDEACAGDVGLRQQIEELLRAGEEANQLALKAETKLTKQQRRH